MRCHPIREPSRLQLSCCLLPACVRYKPRLFALTSVQKGKWRRGGSGPERLRVAGLCCWSLSGLVGINVCLHRQSWINAADARDAWPPWLTDGWRSCWSPGSLSNDCCQSTKSSTRGCHNINVNAKCIFLLPAPPRQLGMEKRGNQTERAITSVPWRRGSRCMEWMEWKGMVAVYCPAPVAPPFHSFSRMWEETHPCGS